MLDTAARNKEALDVVESPPVRGSGRLIPCGEEAAVEHASNELTYFRNLPR